MERIRIGRRRLVQINYVSSSSSYSYEKPRARQMRRLQMHVPIPVPELILFFIFFTSSLLPLGLICKQFPGLEEQVKQHLWLPFNLEDAKNLEIVLDRSINKYFYEVLSGLFLIYFYLETFAIPGSKFHSILSWFVLLFYLALLLVCGCSAVGASLCFFLCMSSLAW